MLKADAKNKLCPFKMGLSLSQDRRCDGPGCMGWDEYMKFVCPDGIQANGKYEQHDPPQGGCGMKPPEEINVNSAY